MKRVVIPAVLEFLSNPSANFDSKIHRHSQVSLIEQIVEIGTKQYAVIGKMRPELAVGLNVGRL